MGPMPGAAEGASADKLKAMTQQLIQMATRPQAGVRQPTPAYSPESMKPGEYNVQQGKSRGQEVGFALQNFGTFVHNAVAQHKQRQVSDAMAEWQGFDTALEKAQVLAGDPSAPDYQQKLQKALAADPWIKANLDPANPKAVKRLKNMYKALHVDLLAEGEENVHRDGLKRFFRSKEALARAKAAKDKMRQYKSDPVAKQRAMSQSLEKLAGMGALKPPEPKALEEAAKTVVDEIGKLADKYQIMPDAQGNILAVDKTHPERPAIQVKGPEGAPVQGADKGRKGPMLVDGVPVGIYRNGKALTPTSPEWTAQDASDFSQFKAAYATSEAAKNARVDRWAKSRINAFLQSRIYPSSDAEGNVSWVSGADIVKHPGVYAPASIAEKVQRANAIIGPEGEIASTEKFLVDAISAVGDTAFTPETRARIAYVLKAPNPSGSLTQFLQSNIASSLTDAQQDYVAALVSMQESALSLRTVAGLGQGSDQLRTAISKMLPGAGTPTQRYALEQLKIFDIEKDALAKGILKLGKPKDNVIRKGMAVPSPD